MWECLGRWGVGGSWTPVIPAALQEMDAVSKDKKTRKELEHKKGEKVLADNQFNAELY